MASILIVEDDPNISGLYAYILKKRGHSVTQARDVAEGLQALGVMKPALIILDLLMPDANGVDFLKQANLEKDYPGTKVFVVSNVDSDDFAKQLEPFHVEKYVTKAQYTPHRIADMVEQAIGVEAGKLRVPLAKRVRRWFKR